MNWILEVKKDGEWIRLDVNSGEENPISLNYRLDDIRDLGTKKKNPFSKTIKLPGTAKNKQFFDNINEISVNFDGLNPKRSYDARILTANDAEVFRGNLILLEIDKSGERKNMFSITITGIIRGLAVDLDGLNIEDLIELDVYDHDRTREIIVNSWTYSIVKNGVLTESSEGDGYVYPYINHGNNSATMFEYSYFYDLYPGVYAKTIWDAVFNRAGRSYESEFLNSPYFKKLILPFTGDKIQLSEDEVLGKTTVRGSLPNGPGFAGAKIWTPLRLPTNTWFYSDQTNYFLPLDRTSGEISGIEFTDINNQFQNNIFTTQVAGYYNIDMKLYFYPRFFLTDPDGSAPMKWKGDSSIQWRWILQKVSANGQVSILDEIPTNEFTPSNEDDQAILWDDQQAGEDFDLVVDTAVSNIWLNVGDVIRLRIGFRPRGGFKWQYTGTILAKETVGTRLMLLPARGGDPSYLSIKPTNNDSLGGESIRLRSTLSKNYKCLDFITDIMKMFNLVIVDDPLNENNYLIEPADDYFDSGGLVKDWNKKIDLSNYTKKPMSEIDSKTYLYKYTKDDDFYNKEYTFETGREWGDYEIELNNNFSKKATVMDISFAPTVNSNFGLGDGKIAPHFVNDEFNKKSVKARILFYDGLKDGDLRLRDKPVGPNDLIFDRYPYCGMLNDPIAPTEDLGFSEPDKYYHDLVQYPFNNLFNKFHRRTFNNIADPNSQILVGYFALTPLDMKDFDFRDVIFLFGQYWRVNLIEDYDPTRRKLTKVELYRIIDYKVIGGVEDVVVSNNQCPSDLVRVRVNRRFYWVSASGQNVSEECCKSIGGNWNNGACEMAWGIVSPVDPVVGGVEPVGPVGPVRPVLPILEATGPKSLNTGANTINNKENIIIGENNYQKKGKSGIIMGTNNTQLKSGTIILGDNKAAREGDGVSIYLPLSEIKSNGEIIKKYNKIDGGRDIVRPLFSQNPEWTLIRSGKDCVRELDYKSVYNVVSGNDSDRIGYPE
jgi:hypothetical protein